MGVRVKVLLSGLTWWSQQQPSHMLVAGLSVLNTEKHSGHRRNTLHGLGGRVCR